jgi:hypothetical protein
MYKQKYSTRQAVYVQRNIEERSCKQCYSRKSIQFYECVFVLLV